MWGWNDGTEEGLWEDSPLRLQSIGNDNSIMLSSYLLFDQRQVQCPLFVDSGCSAMGFLDDDFAIHHQIQRFQLAKPRPLHLADGVFSSYVTHYVVIRLRIGHHHESVSLYVTRLSPANPIILGLPWLREHNPTIDWETSTLYFGTKCDGRCLPLGLPDGLRVAPRIARPEKPAAKPPRSRSPYQASVEEVPNEVEPPPQPPEAVSTITHQRRDKLAGYQRERRLRQRVLARWTALGNTPPTLTRAPGGQQGKLIATGPQLH